MSRWRRLSTNLGVNTAILLFNATLIAVLWGAALAWIAADRDDTIRHTLARTDSLAIALEQYSSRTIDSAEAVLRSLIREHARGKQPPDLVRFITEYRIGNDLFSGVGIANERGEATLANYTLKSINFANVADREHFRVHLDRNDGKVFVGKPVLGRITGMASIPFTQRFNKPDGTLGGVAMVLIVPSKFTDVLVNAELGGNDIVSLVGLDGVTRARLQGSAVSSEGDSGAGPLFAGQLARRPGGAYLAAGSPDGVSRFFSYRTLAGRDLVATVGTSEAEAMSGHYNRRAEAFWAAGLGSVAITGFAVLLMFALASRTRAAEKAQDSAAQYRLLFDHNPHPMWVYDLETLRFVAVNAAAIRHYGYSREEFLAMTIRDIRPTEDVTALKVDIDELRELGRAVRVWRHCKHDRSLIEVEISADDIAFDGRAARLILAHDVTDKRKAAAAIKGLNRVYALLSGINTLIVRVRDNEELFREACQVAVEAGGMRMSILVMVRGEKIVTVASAGQDDALLADVEAVLASPRAPMTMVARAIASRDAVVSNDPQHDPSVMLGPRYAAAGVGSLVALPLIIADHAVGGLLLYASEADFFHAEEMQLLTQLAADIAHAIDHIAKRERLDYLAYYDSLTGLANRTLFLERVGQLVRGAGAAEKLAVFLFDLERFKNINDTLGRAAGDEVLKQVAQWLARRFGDANLLARVGADHFAVVLPDARQAGEVARTLEKLLGDLVEHSFRVEEAALRIAAKVGVALYPDDATEAETLFTHAEAALKKAKARGNRYLFYAQEMSDAVAGRLALENQLREALERGEFVLHYQPKVSLADGRITGAEALIRWNDPRTGLVPPLRFIPVLEETGLIHEVGHWALKQAIADGLRWRSAGMKAMRIGVNVSPMQLRSPGFVATIARAIAVDPSAASGLELEITESLIMEDVRHGGTSLEAIRAMGVSIAIDDFGTGFSSLSYLAKLPVDILKIDRSFIVDMTAGPEGLVLVSTIIKLAHALKIKVAAEGVETEEQRHLLRLLSCDEMQGFLFSKPLPAADFEARFLGAAAELAGP
jgi:diguanylate cyclase (GGDEF)-like protein/PAS domain S-box-containing protein